jgi:MSHA biogenesis protein MshP
MCPEPRRETGFAAPLAVFVIILGAVLAGAIAMVSGTQQSGTALDILGTRAYQASRAGLEWGVHHVLRAGGLDCTGINDGDGAGNGTSFSPGGGLADFRVTVRCTSSAHTEGTTAVVMYALSAAACNLPTAGPPSVCPNPAPGSPSYAERELRATVGSN